MVKFICQFSFITPNYIPGFYWGIYSFKQELLDLPAHHVKERLELINGRHLVLFNGIINVLYLVVSQLLIVKGAFIDSTSNIRITESVPCLPLVSDITNLSLIQSGSVWYLVQVEGIFWRILLVRNDRYRPVTPFEATLLLWSIISS
jgi:hypothetical protein